MSQQLPQPNLLLSDLHYSSLKEHIIESTGLAYYRDKDPDLAEKIAKRFVACKVHTCLEYLGLLQDGEAGELDELVADLTIGETYFFRHDEQFEAIKRMILPDLIQKNAARRQLRIWSAGCATGAEAYSLAIMLKRDFAQALAGWDITILGTDINRKFLSAAREGNFGDWALRVTPEEIKNSCFSHVDRTWLLLDDYRQGVAFQYHNLVKNPYPSLLHNLAGFDLILCRNVMIYFSRDVIEGCVGRFWNTLVEGGWLVVGHAEINIDLFHSFNTVDYPGTLIFERGQRQEKTITAAPDSYPPALFEPAGLPSPPVSSDLPLFLQQPPITEPIAEDFVERLETAQIRELADRADWPNAAALCQKLIEKDKINPLGHFYHALVLEQMQQLKEAEASLNRAIYLNRNFVLAHYHKGLLLQKNREPLEAIRSFQNALTLLQQMNPQERFSEADHISVADLAELAQMQMEILEQI